MAEFQHPPKSTGFVSKGNQNVHLEPRMVSSKPIPKYETIQVVYQDKITKIVLNRPKKKNAFSVEMYQEVCTALDDAGEDDSVLTVVTGQGDYFSSGNDLSNALRPLTGSPEEMMKGGSGTVRDLIGKIIDFPKPLVAMVNGPAVGIATTILGLFDLVYASDKATFNTPFSKLALYPEGCSSYTFPKIMGLSKAIEVLVFNKILTAQEAYHVGFVAEVFPDSTFQQEVWSRLTVYATLPKNCLALSKQLIRNLEKEKLHEVCDKEMEAIAKGYFSEEAKSAIQNFFQRKAKL
ncbi:enoyl-CoA delta isomerase 2-like [Bufo gargarizans]|uniref:enoyl-CoA delta isomerase 2-like n=1 Tax=Bufo gargarizans TaxID=30331 RepID=UPI001CF4B0C6|nr:enoyl-CoA delta isomerase 2-like [Bufo gargarizans]